MECLHTSLDLTITQQGSRLEQLQCYPPLNKSDYTIGNSTSHVTTNGWTWRNLDTGYLCDRASQLRRDTTETGAETMQRVMKDSPPAIQTRFLMVIGLRVKGDLMWWKAGICLLESGMAHGACNTITHDCQDRKGAHMRAMWIRRGLLVSNDFLPLLRTTWATICT